MLPDMSSNSKPRVVHVCKSDRGGAFHAGYRLHQGLLEIGVDSSMLVHSKSKSDPEIIGHDRLLERTWGRLASRLDFMNAAAKTNGQLWQSNWLPTPTVRRINRLNPDIVNLHWLGSGFFRPEDLHRIQCPVVWTMHDMNAFTGGCFYDENCGKFVDGCSHCPQLIESGKNDLSYRNWKRKVRIYESFRPQVVCPSQWLADCASSSRVFRDHDVVRIPYGLNLELFHPLAQDERAEARNAFGFPADKQVVLFGSAGPTHDTRKGFDLLRGALQHLGESTNSNLFLAVFGSTQNFDSLDLKLPGSSVGFVRDPKQLAKLYSSSDVFVAPSRQDNLPNTVLESLSCGTPVVAFDIGGMPDMIQHLKTGFLAAPFQLESLANGIVEILQLDRVSVSHNCRSYAEQNYALKTQALAYQDLYVRLISQSSPVD